MKVLEEKELGSCSKRFTIELESEDLEREENNMLEELREHAVLPGFRRGKAPTSLLKKRFKKSLTEGTLDNARKEALKQVLEERNIDAVGEPNIKADGEAEKAEEARESEEPEDGEEKAAGEKKAEEPISLTFTAEIEFIPELELPDYKNLTVEEPDLTVTESDIAEHLERIRESNALLRGVDDRAAQDGDSVTIKVEGTIDGEPFPEGTHENYHLVLGQGSHLPGFEESIVGRKTDEEFKTELEFPEDYQVERLRGKKATFQIQVNEIRERVLPDLDDEFAKDLGFDTLQEIKDMIRGQLESNLEQRKSEAKRANLVRQLVESTPFEAPPSMVQGRYQYLRSMQEYQLQRVGSSLDSLDEERREQVQQDNLVAAERQTRASILMAKIAEKEAISISNEEFAQEVAEMAMRAGQDPRAYIQSIMQSGMDQVMRQEFLEKKVLDHLLGEVDIETVPPEEMEEDALLDTETDVEESENEEKAD